jgi:hypothetical protein
MLSMHRSEEHAEANEKNPDTVFSNHARREGKKDNFYDSVQRGNWPGRMKEERGKEFILNSISGDLTA